MLNSVFSITVCIIYVCSTLAYERLSCNGSAISERLFQHISEISKLVAISYCVGREGIQYPFSCLSHCEDFPSLELVQTWDTGLITNSCGYIAVSKSHAAVPRIYVLFRGTSSLSNFLSDLQTTHAVYTPYSGSSSHQCDNCTVHEGFMLAWNATRGVLMPQLEILHAEYPNHTVVFSGHSLGGAVAGLAGLEIMNTMKWANVEVVTFGEPMFGNEHMAAYVDETFFCHPSLPSDRSCSYMRVTHAGDPVPDLPPSQWGWSSHASEIHILKDGVAPKREDVVWCGVVESDQDVQEIVSHGVDLRTLKEPTIGETKIPDLLHEQTPAKSGFTRSSWGPWFAHREYFSKMGLCFDPDWMHSGEKVLSLSRR